MENKLIKNKFALLFVFLMATTVSNSQILMPYNLDFEEGTVGWELSKKSKSNGFSVFLSDSNSFYGQKHIKLSHATGKNIIPATFYQQIDANFYKHKKVRFSAMLRIEHGWNSPILFISAKNKNNIIVASASTEEKNTSSVWGQTSLELEIPSDADIVTFGLSHKYSNPVHIDNCSFSLVNDEDEKYYESSSKLLKLEKIYLLNFANTYGYIKYFCANSELNNINWNDVLLTNIFLSKKISSQEEILPTLQKKYKNLAPQVIISNNSTENINTNKNNSKYSLMKLYTGVPVARNNNLTSSKIINIKGSLKEKDGIAVQYLNNLREHNGKQLSISVKSKIRQFHPAATARVDIRFEDKMGDFVGYYKSNLITSSKWSEAEIKCIIPKETTRAAVILSMNGYAQAYFDDVKAILHHKKQNINLKINNSGFEEYLVFNQDNWLIPNESISDGYDINYTEIEKASGKMSLVIFTDSTSLPALPEENTVIHEKISEDLYIHLPLAVSADLIKITNTRNSKDSSIYDLQTYPIPTGKFIPETGKNTNFNLNWQDRGSRLAIIIELWNLIKHFCLTEVDASKLNNELALALEAAAECDTAENFRDILQQLLDITHDARARAWFSGDTSQSYSFPFLLELLDDKLFISDIILNNTINNIEHDFLASEILEINSMPISEYFKEKIDSRYDWERIKQLALFRIGKKNSTEKIKIKTKKGEIKEFSAVRNSKSSETSIKRINPIELLDNNILYINLTEVEDNYLLHMRDSLYKYNKFIFDLRGEASVSEAFLTLLTSEPVFSSYTCVPFFSKPNKKLISYYKRGGVFAPAEKSIEGEFVFLVDWRTSGTSELFASVIASKKIGKLVGSKTQGSLIAAVAMRLDDVFSVSIGTVYGYTPADVSTYNNPIVPDVQVVKTVEDIINNSDVALEQAVQELLK